MISSKGLGIYVCGKWEDKHRVQEVMGMLVLCGHYITHDWTVIQQESRANAIKDLRGVMDADVVVGVFEKDLKYCGTLIELGAALSHGKPVYIIGEAPVTRSMFFQHPAIQRDNNAFARDLLGGHQV